MSLTCRSYERAAPTAQLREHADLGDLPVGIDGGRPDHEIYDLDPELVPIMSAGIDDLHQVLRD